MWFGLAELLPSSRDTALITQETWNPQPNGRVGLPGCDQVPNALLPWVACARVRVLLQVPRTAGAPAEHDSAVG